MRRAGDQPWRGDRGARADVRRGADEQRIADTALAAHALAYIVIANRRFTDLFEWGQRSLPLSLAAEIQHRLLPATYTCEAGQFTVAGWLEPAGNIAGDTFDFSLERDTLHLSMTDAVGHAVDAAMLATVLVGALRNARRAGVGLAEQAAGRAPRAGRASRAERVRHRAARARRPARRNGAHRQRRSSAPLRLRGGRVETVALRPTSRSRRAAPSTASSRCRWSRATGCCS